MQSINATQQYQSLFVFYQSESRLVMCEIRVDGFKR